MRAAVLVAVSLAACAPDIVSDSYLCGPNQTCPEDQVCNGANNHCVLASSAEPFSCKPQVVTEPDDSADKAYAIPQLNCSSVPYAEDNCMLEQDPEDWIKVATPTGCSSDIKIQAHISFPIAWERLGIQLWDLGTMTKLADDSDCTTTGLAGDDTRCLTSPVGQGMTYGLRVYPLGEGNCDGGCSYNRYKLSVQLATSN